MIKMSPNVYHDGNPTVVAVDRDKHSTSAVKWAIENLLVNNNTTLILLHVRITNLHNHGSNNNPPEVNGDSMEDVFTHFRAFCARKRLAMQVVILEGVDVHGTLLDYIISHHITNIVLGASSRSPISRKFWTHDVPTMINKAAPDFCTVYVIAKGKTQSVRPAARQATSSIPPRLPSSYPSPGSSVKSSYAETDDSGSYRCIWIFWNRAPRSSKTESIKSEITSTDVSMDYRHNEAFSRASKHSSNDGYGTQNWLLKTLSSDSTEVSSRGSRSSSSFVTADNEPEEIIEREASSSFSGYELNQHKHSEIYRSEQARMAEEAAIALIEAERLKCRAAIEAAERAQRLAEKETQRRRHVEMKAKQEAKEKVRALDFLSNNDIRYRKYTIEEIEKSTNNFSRSMKIGEGGYGPVYKGKLDHTRVAIKVLRPDAAQGRKQFQQEVEVLSVMRHPNMVLLMGACPEFGCLVYEYMNNGSLEDRLFRKGNSPPIPWAIRFKIAADIATGLLFLHQAKPEPLVHRDLKPANILLDRHYTCKISDVGLARLVPPSVADSVTQYHMTSAAGTFCYIDPEYQQTGKLGTKSDIYSLGVMLLQIITARPPMGLTHQVERAIEKDTFADLLDPTVPDWPVEEALGYARLALKCAELRKKDRPDLAKDILPELSRLKGIGMERLLGHKSSIR
ncbi:hypothetical protein CASFOL_022298 [Castilleja foliolosa]|uniref:RING-type E3 ubiquitin transferase n=1 Tax=Castilleja foliolosa TaxID=1961234 RepID=A0ABD3CXJ4_9LAMI